MVKGIIEPAYDLGADMIVTPSLAVPDERRGLPGRHQRYQRDPFSA